MQKFGFTLIEIMIALIIVGLVGSLAVPAFLNLRDDARIHEAEARVDMLAAAIRQLAWDTGEWPGGIMRTVIGNAEIWDLKVSAAGLLSADWRFENWKGPYIADIPADPWGSDYFFDPDYYVGGKVVSVVGSFGPNRKGRNLYDSDDIIVILSD
jgi:general secretion pathway protein G